MIAMTTRIKRKRSTYVASLNPAATPVLSVCSLITCVVSAAVVERVYVTVEYTSVVGVIVCVSSNSVKAVFIYEVDVTGMSDVT